MSYTTEWLSGAGSAVSGLGGLLGLPEFGISEYISGQPAPVSAQTPPTDPFPAGPAPYIEGVSTDVAPTGPSAPSSPTNPTQPGTDPLAALYAEIDNIYNSTMNFLGQQESSLRANVPVAQSDVEGQFAGAKMSAETEKGVGMRDLGTAGVQAGQRKEDALSAGRRLFNELQMGGQQRFGGASSAGQAYSELTGREFQRGQATTQQAFQNAMTKVTDLKSNLEERFSSAMFNLEQQKVAAMNQIRTTFEEKLGQINALRAQAGENKSTQRLNLLQDLRNQVYQLNLAAVQTQTQLNAQKQQAEQQLQSVVNAVTQAQTGSQQATGNLMNSTTTAPQTALGITGRGQAPAMAYQGIRRPEDELTGQIAPRKEDFLFA